MSQAQVQDPFDAPEFDSAKPSGGVYLLPGSYPEVELIACKLAKSSKDRSICFIAELKVIKSNVAERPAGSVVSWVCKNKHASFFGNVRDFISKATGEPFEEITQDVCRGCVSDAQPLKGTKFAVVCTNITTSTGNPFTKHAWSLLPKAESKKS